MGFAGDEWFPSRLPFGKFKGRLHQDAELSSWLRSFSGQVSYFNMNGIKPRPLAALRDVRAQREELETEIGRLKEETGAREKGIGELVGASPF